MSILSARIFAFAAAATQWLCAIESHWSPELARAAHCVLTAVLTCIEQVSMS